MIGCRICTKCNENKPFSEFGRKHGKVIEKCKSCANLHSREYRKNNPEKIKALNKKSYEENCESYREYRRNYVKNNPEKIKLSQKVYYEANKEEMNAISREYYKNNKDSVIKQHNQYIKNKREKDPLFALSLRIKSNIHSSLKRKNMPKKSKTIEIIGCSFEELYTHLVLSAINNYGLYLETLDYHIDHIIPIAVAQTEDDVIRLNHYTNLQYLYPDDNHNKADSLDWSLHPLTR